MSKMMLVTPSTRRAATLEGAHFLQATPASSWSQQDGGATGWIGDFSVSDTLGGKNDAMLVPAA